MPDRHIEVRAPSETEAAAFDAVPHYVFALPQEDVRAYSTQPVPLASAVRLGVYVDGKVATTYGWIPWQVRLNGRPTSIPGVTAVGTYPQFRRRGHLRRLMAKAMEVHRERGEPIVMLWASMGAIYQRFGYGRGSEWAHYNADPRYIGLREPFTWDGEIRLIDQASEAERAIVERVYDEWARPRNLVPIRDAARWTHLWWEAQWRGYHVAVAEDASGRARGSIAYKTKENWVPGEPGPDQAMEIQGLFALDLDARRALWQYVRAHDLVLRARFEKMEPDDPIQDLLLEPRELRRFTGDGMWVRIVDVPRALEARPYSEAGELTLRVHDNLAPWNDTTWRFETDGEQTHVVEATGATADLDLSINALASLLTGFRSATHIERAGMLSGDPGAVRRADAIFATAYAPHMPEGF